MSLENVLKEQSDKLEELKMATVFLQHRGVLKEQLLQLKVEMDYIVARVNEMRQDLETMKNQNNKLHKLIALFKQLEAKIIQMELNLPAEFIKDFTQLNAENSPYVTRPDKNNSKSSNENQVIQREKAVSIDTPQSCVKDCKKTLFQNAEDSYTMEMLSEEEFAKIPKYMIGRQSMNALNDFITAINQILQAKYSLLSLGKMGARKKGKLDLYLSFKRDEIVVAPGEDPIYFFTAEDYHRHTQSKLDKTKLNLLTVLRHCKRLRELRAGKSLQYVVIPTS